MTDEPLPLFELSPDALEQLEAYRQAHETQLLVLLMSDLEGSTHQQARLGNVRAAKLVQEHRRIFRGVLAGMDGQEVETAGDSFLTVFAAPSEAVLFALRMQRAMRLRRENEPDLPGVRVGIHLGQVVVERHDSGSKPVDLYGLQLSITARIMDLGVAGQILCSREVFNNARAILRGEQLAGLNEVAWRNHGPYHFKGVEEETGAPESHEVCEAGEIGHAPLEKPKGSGKSRPADAGDGIFGWRPGPEAVLPATNWRLERKLGEGGFGEVWLARDKGGRQTVFKFCTKRGKLRSLRREFDVFNALVRDGKSPPGIAEVIEGRDDRDGDGPYYIRLAYVGGGDLKGWIENVGARASLRMLLDLAQQMARAVARIHAAGFVHRDIKPSNFLVEPEDDPARAPTLRLCDFGIGHEVLQEAIKEGASTRDIAGGGGQYSVGSQSFLQAAGTFVYIAPELQLSGADTPGKIAKDALPPADIYSLGVSLFQLFTANSRQAPGVDLAGLVDPILREDIAACLHRDPAQRPTAAELAERLERYEDRARERERTIQRARARRLRLAIGAVSAVAIVIGVVATLAVFQWREAHDQREQAESARQAAEAERARAEEQQREAEAERQAAEAERARAEEQQREAEAERQAAEAERVRADEKATEARKQLYRASISEVQTHLEARRYDLASVALWQAPVEYSEWEWGYLAQRVETSLAVLEGHSDEVTSAEFSPDGRSILTVSTDGAARLWDASTGETLFVFGGEMGSYWVESAEFSPDGHSILIVSMDGAARLRGASTGETLFVFGGEMGSYWVDSAADVPDDRPGVREEMGSYWVESAEFSPDGRSILTVSSGDAARVWDATSGKMLIEIEIEGGLYSAVFSPDGRRILTESVDGIARICDAETGETLYVLEGQGFRRDFGVGCSGENWFTAPEFSPDGRRIVSVSDLTAGDVTGRSAHVWNAESGLLLNLLEHEHRVYSAAYSPDGRRILTVSMDGTARVWDAETGAELHVLEGQVDEEEEYVLIAAFSPAGRRIITTRNYTARVWDATSGELQYVLEGHTDWIYSVAFSPDGRRVVTTSKDKTARVWYLDNSDAIHTFEGVRDDPVIAAFSPDGRQILTASASAAARLLEPETGKMLHALEGHTDRVSIAAYSPDGRRILTGSRDGTARVWDAETGKTLHIFAGHANEVTSAVFSPDGHRIITAPLNRARGRLEAFRWRDSLPPAIAGVWDTETGKNLFVLEGHTDRVSIAAFSPDGRRILTGSREGTARLWDAETGESLHALEGYTDRVSIAAFSPDGRRILTSSGQGTARLWDAESGENLFVLKHSQDPLEQIILAMFSLDGGRIVTVGYDSFARVWDAETAGTLYVLQGWPRDDHMRASHIFSTSPDGRLIVTDSGERTGRLLDADTGEILHVLEGHRSPLRSASFSPSGRRIVTSSLDQTARIWDTESGVTLCVLEGHTYGTKSAEFSPDGRHILTRAMDGAARVWSAAPWRLEDLPVVEGSFATPEEERKARFFEWKRQRYQGWLAAQGESP